MTTDRCPSGPHACEDPESFHPADFTGKYVDIEVDGTWFGPGFVFEDDGVAEIVEVSDPEIDPYMIGAPMDIPRSRLRLAAEQPERDDS